MRNLFIKLIAVYALKDSKAWGEQPRISQDAILIVSAIPALSVPALAHIVMYVLFGVPLFGVGDKEATVAIFAVWCLLWFIMTRKVVSLCAQEIESEIARLAALPESTWHRRKTVTVMAVALFLVVLLVSSIFVLF